LLQHDRRAKPVAVGTVADTSHMTATISSTVGGSAGFCSPLLRGGRPR
jgi:hypothetical protein